MYVPPAFSDDRLDVLHAIVQQHSFASIVTNGRDGPVASHVPVLLLREHGQLGTHQFHLAKQNAQWRALADDANALVMFHGPHA
jgi:transcriptional regulator